MSEKTDVIYELLDLGDHFGYSKFPGVLMKKARDYEVKYEEGAGIVWRYYDDSFPHYWGWIDGRVLWTIQPIFLEES